MKRPFLFLLNLTALLVLSLGVFDLSLNVSAETNEKDTSVTISTLTESQAGYISQSCASIKQGLKALQRTDVAIRSYLGTIYETALTSFISPLNVRLAKNNLPSAVLTDLHSSFIIKRQDFSHLFVTYSQDFENLLNVDCKNEPEAFYDQLLKTRKSRAALEKSVDEVNSILNKVPSAIQKIEETLP